MLKQTGNSDLQARSTSNDVVERVKCVNFIDLIGMLDQAAVGRQDLPCPYLVHHQPESANIT